MSKTRADFICVLAYEGKQNCTKPSNEYFSNIEKVKKTLLSYMIRYFFFQRTELSYWTPQALKQYFWCAFSLPEHGGVLIFLFFWISYKSVLNWRSTAIIFIQTIEKRKIRWSLMKWHGSDYFSLTFYLVYLENQVVLWLRRNKFIKGFCGRNVA